MKLLFIILFTFIAKSSFAVMATFDAANAKMQALKKTELVTQTKEMIDTGKTIAENGKTLKKSYDSMVDKIDDAKSYYDRAMRIRESASSYMKQLKSLDVIKTNGFKFDFKEPSLLQSQVSTLYTDVSEDEALAHFGQKYREEQRNEIAKASVANAQSIIYQQETKAAELEELTQKYENADEMAEKQSVENAILLNILQQMNVMTQLQAEMNAVILGKEAQSMRAVEYDKWDNRDWYNHYKDGGSKRTWKTDTQDKAVMDSLGL